MIIVKAGNKNKIQVGDKVFFYDSQNKTVNVALATITKKEVITPKEITFTVGQEHDISSANVIGTTKDTTVIPVVGGILSVIESKWGFLFLIVFPSLIAFLYEISVVFSEIRESKKEGKSSK